MSPAVSDALGGQVEGVILALGAVAAHIRSGAFKPIVISNPFPELPNVPTMGKLGFKQDLLGVWFAWMAPQSAITRAAPPSTHAPSTSRLIAVPCSFPRVVMPE